MVTKEFKGRFVQKHDTEANWLLAVDFVPMKGEIIVYDPDEQHSYSRTKVGDGVRTINELEFATNQPDEFEALAVAAELGLIEPIVSAHNEMYTDSKGAIYTLI